MKLSHVQPNNMQRTKSVVQLGWHGNRQRTELIDPKFLMKDEDDSNFGRHKRAGGRGEAALEALRCGTNAPLCNEIGWTLAMQTEENWKNRNFR